MLEFLTVVGLVVLLAIGLLVTAAWLTLRRIRRSRLVARGTQALEDGLLALTACRPRPTTNRGAAVRALRISREHQLLRQHVGRAERSGAHLGEVPALLPRLEAEGRRLRTALGLLVGSPTPALDVVAQADRHLATLADLSQAVGAAAVVPVPDPDLAREAEEAATGLRLHSAAYAELMAIRPGARGSQSSPRPLADAS